MTTFIRNKPYTGPICGVVLDWAGTAVDFGCIGPAAVFINVFKKNAISVSVQDARQFMGLMKKDHIRGMCGLDSVADQWIKKFGRRPSEADIDHLYNETEPMMVSAISHHAEPIKGLLETIEGLRQRQIAIGSSTGYTRPMMDVLVPLAQKKGYAPDVVVCSSDVPAGRPYPWMCYLNAIRLNVYPMEAMVKIGDTVSDIEEGLNAGMWTVGLTKSGNELGLTEAEIESLDDQELRVRLSQIEDRYHRTGAHYVIEGIWDCLPVIDEINRRLVHGETPLCTAPEKKS